MANLPGLSFPDFLSRFLTEQKQSTFIIFFADCDKNFYIIDFQTLKIVFLTPDS